EAPPRRSSPSPRPGQLLLLSARTASALETATRELAQHLEASPGLDVADVAFTLAEGRQSFEHRRAVVAGSTAGLVERLRKPAASRVVEDVAAARLRRVAFLFPGQGAQAPGMGRELYAAEPTFRQQVDEALARLPSSLRDGVRTLLLAPPGQEQEAARLASATRHALPALFIMEHALARLWMSWGVRPHALLGHSYGEYVAACLAGVLSLDDGLRLVVARGELMSRLPPGAMLAVGLSEAQVQPLLSGGLSLAAVNAPERCVVSGPVAQVERLHEELKRREVGALRLPAAHAFHSADVEPLMPGLAQQVASLARSAPSVRYVSSLTGTWVRPEEAREPAYWAEQMRQPVRFAAGLETLLRDGCGLLLEVGPGQDLTALARACLGEEERERVRALPSLRRAGGSGPDSNVLLQSLGELWAHGLEVDWKSFYTHERRLRLPLPTYPFEEKRCWLEDASTPRPQAPLPAAVPTAAPVVALPLGEVEQRVAALWRERLGIEHVGRDDDFLGLGGNSLMAAQLLTQLRETFGVQLPLSDLFEAPTLAGLSARIEALLRAAQAAPSSSVPVPALVPLPRTGELPLSCVQERVWRLEQAFPGLSAYNLPLALRLEGALHLEALEHGLQEVVRRHELLRTTYTRVEGRPVQRVSSQAHVVLRRVELSGPRDAAEAEALRLAREDALAPFSLEDGPVLRTTLVRVAEDVHVLLVCFHHIVGDTLSILLFVRELGALYEAFRGGQPSPLPPMPVQYADFGAWQRRALAEGGLSGQQAWWRQQLAGMPRQLALPTDRPRPAVPQLTSVRKRVRFPSHLAGQVTAFGKREGATSFMVLLAAWQALLHRYSGQDDIVVATPIANRARPELQPLIGYVAHSLALRTDLSGDPSFQELLGRVREVTLGAQAHPDVPFEQLVEELHPERDIGRERMADSVFVVHAVESSAPLELPGLRLSSLELPEAPVQWGATLADLSVSLNEEPGQLEGFVEYAAELFEPERIERLLGHYQTLLEAALARPEERLSRLPLATGAELRALPWTELPPDSSLVRELRAARPARPSGTRGVAMSLSFFANDEDSLAGPKYELLLEAAKFADAHGFSAVWTPERHFHSFGGLYPQPAVVGAALAAVTRNLRIRAGSVVLPLHDPLLVAEQWSVVDNLSAGRVGVSFASGWHVHDFVFAPERYAERKAVMLREVETVRALWRGERVKRKGGDGAEVEVGLRPRPVQPELPIWLTAASNPETFRLAGELGAGVLTLLAAHDWAQLQEKVALYREAWRRHGHGPGRGHVTVLLHTFIGTDARRVRDLVRQPLLRYFRSSLDIMSSLLASQGFQGHIDRMTEADVEAMLVHGYELYVRQRGLIGTVEEAEERLRQAVDADVDEVAALIDFGLDTAVVLDGLKHLAEVRRRHEAGAAPWPEVEPSATGVEARVLDGAGQPVPVGVVGELALGVAAAASRSVSHPLRPSARLSLTGRRARLLAEGEVELLAPASAPSRSPTSSPVRPAPAPAIAPVSREEPLPLSFAQQRLWYLQQLEPGSAAYNNAAAFRLSGPLDADALQATLGEMVRRHEVLRTTYALTPRGAVQVIHPPGDVPLPRVGLEEATPEAREAELTRLCREEARQPFDLERGPVLRALLVRVQPEEHVLSLVLHHIVSDGWTAMVVARELVGLYGAFAAGRPSPLPPLAVQYADYAAWQRRVLEGPVLAEQLGWWKQQLAGVPALALPLDRPRPAVQSYAGSRHTFFLPKELSEALLALGRREGATPFMTMLALWQVFLHRYSGQEDFAVGAPIAGRERPETQALIGCFVNTLALRAPLSGRPSFREVLARVRQVALGAYAHQEVPFDRLVEVLQVPRDLGGTPVFQVMLNLNSAAEAGSTPSQVRVGVVEVPSDSAKFDLTLDVWEERDGLRCRLEYATALFEPDTVARMAANLARLARSAVEDPARAVGALELVEEEERRRVLVEWNDTRAPLPREACAHHLFEAQAARTPDAPAVAFGEDVFTYAELDRRANQLAHHLRSLGVDAESCVGLCLERSLDAVVAMLGILKAGGAFLPLDPSYPKARLAFLMEDAAIPLLVTRGEVLAAVPEGIRRLCLTADAQALAHQPGSPPATRADGET
ncbi:MAG TPA: MupA/Atu3671 family FMN-dependent luciferase-like monooxygenase, partial [Myxococcus sp.]|nr:MupA/Atu3671 family FMN-dependent luciferase-like monooxygenase [Myxococcus sp.]